eukprot:Skav228854  [mRNA]  locus=scaffold1718:130032:132638:+ [translate_table: standard]
MDLLLNGLGNASDPWIRKAYETIMDDQSVHFAYIDNIDYRRLHCFEGQFIPFTGVDFAASCKHVTIQFRALPEGFQKFQWIGFKDFHSDDGVIFQEGKQSIIWVLAKFQPNSPLMAVHLFSGAFSGWERALNFLIHEGKLSVDLTISIDSDDDVMRVWSKNKSARIFYNRIPVDQIFDEDILGVMRPIQDSSWLNLMRKSGNWVLTMSPPCPSWSPGGVSKGLRCEEGFSFVEAINTVKKARPLVVSCECSDSTPTHRDFHFLRACFHRIGYKAVWSTVLDLDTFSGMKRSRWIAVWIRNDVTQRVHVGNFKFGIPSITWENPMFDFPTPAILSEQLPLTPSQLKVYGNTKFIPPNKRFLLPEDPTVEQVLEIRAITKGMVLPTLCASYGKQHSLSDEHLPTRGIYASLLKDQDEWKFINPLIYLSMFGLTVNKSVVIATRLSIICKQLGNSIALPHALLGLLVALNTAGLIESPINETIRSAWAMKITAENSLVIHIGDFIWIIPDVLCMVENPFTIKPTQEQSFRIAIAEKTFPVPNCSIATLLTHLGMSEVYIAELTFLCAGNEISTFYPIGTFLGSCIELWRKNIKVFEFTVLPFTKRSVEAMKDQHVDENPRSTADQLEHNATSIRTPGEFCGWTLMRKWAKVASIDIDGLIALPLPDGIEMQRCFSFKDDDGRFVFDLEPAAKFALFVRRLAISQASSESALNAIFGATGDEDMKEDPWKPWSKDDKKLGR